MTKSILLFGGGGIAQGIIEVNGGSTSVADVRSPHDIQAALRRPVPDVVINCAGVSAPGTLDSAPDYEAEIEINLIGSFNVAAMAIEAGVPTLIFIASVAGLYGKPNHSGYCASKAGVISLVQSLAMEGHDAYVISPGRVDTKMREADYPGEDPRTRLTPTQIGEVVRSILIGCYTPGDNIIIRKQGYDTYHDLDRGDPWRTYLRVGEPPLV